MSSKFAPISVPRSPEALIRKLLYSVSHIVRVDSFAPFKRVVDVVLATFLVSVSTPLILCLMVWRHLRRKPLLVRTERVGKLGKRYTEYTFAGFERSPLFRRLPMLLNILAGEMSVVGPRPVAPDDPIVHASGGARLSVKPGVICSWWLRKRANIDFDDEAAADHEYLNTASLASDLGIVLRAIPALAFAEKRGAAPKTVEVLGIRIDNLSMFEAVEWMRQRLRGEGQSLVCMTNAHCANVSCRDAAYHKTLLSSGLNLADGVGMRIAGKLKGTPIRQNVNGTDLFPRLCALLETTGDSLYLLGGRPGVARNVADWIGKRYPKTVVAGCRDGYFEPTEEPVVAEAIRRSGASVLLVAMGVPAQELWMRRNLERTGVRIAIGVGGLLDFYSGRIPRAPMWMREVGLEWTYRLLQEPGRMWKRYLIGNWTFLARFLFYHWKLYRPHRKVTGGVT